jgi:phosphopantetheinyl transferase (holo-ACP synthase)
MEPLRSMFLARNDEDAEVHRAFGHETGADVSASLLLFSLKEAIVKAISADVGAFLELQDMQVFPDEPGRGKVVYRGRVFRGSLWARSSGPYLVTAAFLSEALED